jgi:hypothetical protein
VDVSPYHFPISFHIPRVEVSEEPILVTNQMREGGQIFRYLNHIPEFGIWYSVSCSLDLVGFSDADFVGCGIDQKSVSGTCYFLGSSLVCWSSRKQSSVA